MNYLEVNFSRKGEKFYHPTELNKPHSVYYQKLANSKLVLWTYIGKSTLNTQ